MVLGRHVQYQVAIVIRVRLLPPPYVIGVNFDHSCQPSFFSNHVASETVEWFTLSEICPCLQPKRFYGEGPAGVYASGGFPSRSCWRALLLDWSLRLGALSLPIFCPIWRHRVVREGIPWHHARPISYNMPSEPLGSFELW